jgi:hypothetical protein
MHPMLLLIKFFVDIDGEIHSTHTEHLAILHAFNADQIFSRSSALSPLTSSLLEVDEKRDEAEARIELRQRQHP